MPPSSATTVLPRRARTHRGRRAHLSSALVGAVLATGVVLTQLVPAAPVRVSTATTTVRATADVFLDSRTPERRLGTQPFLRTDGDPAGFSLLRFSVPKIDGGIGRAELRLFAESTGYASTTVRTVTGRWDEASTWQGRPNLGRTVVKPAKHRSGTWVSLDVTSAVAAGSTLDLALVGTRTSAERFASREKTDRAPRLLITARSAAATPSGSPAARPQPPASTAPPVAAVAASEGPVRAAFYYPWFPEAWKQQGHQPFTNYQPTAGWYDSGDQAVVDRALDEMAYAGMDAVVSSWWGPGSPTDRRLRQLLDRAALTGLDVAVYAEREGTTDPTVDQVRTELDAILSGYAGHPAYLHVEGKPVVFVYGGPTDSCDMARRWTTANAGRAFLVLKAFTGYRSCDARPSAYHQYAPAERSVTVGGDAVSVSPGFWKKGEAPRLARDLAAFESAVAAMAAAPARFHLVTTYNEWGEGTSVEPAREWATPNGRGAYLDVLSKHLAKDPVVVAAGDISCAPDDKNFNGGAGTSSACRQKAVSDLIGQVKPAAVLALGDIQYQCGEAENYTRAFDPSWGRFKSLIRPAIGNHEYGRACQRNDASPYFDYFGAAAGPRHQGWYSYDVGRWHVIALNSECHYGSGPAAVGGCDTGSPQETWLRKDLAAHPNRCTLAYWHEPRWSSGQHGGAMAMTAIWNDLVEARADVVLSGHNHDYERFDLIGKAPADSSAPRDSTTTGEPVFQEPVLDPQGVRQFVVGTGGKNHYGFSHAPLNGQQVTESSTYGLLKLTLHPTSYDWEFVPEAGKSFTDKGRSSCV